MYHGTGGTTGIHPAAGLGSIVVVATFALLAASCAGVGSPNAGNGTPDSEEAVQAPNLEPTDAVDSSGDLAEAPPPVQSTPPVRVSSGGYAVGSARTVVMRVDQIIADGGALVEGTVTSVSGEPAILVIRVDRVIVGSYQPDRELTFASYVRRAYVGPDEVAVDGRAYVLVAADGEIVAVAAPAADGGNFIDRGYLNAYMLGATLDEEPGLAIPESCASEGSYAEDTLTGVVEYVGSRDARIAYGAEVGLYDRAADLADETGAFDETWQRPVSSDYYSIHRQLRAGVPVDELVYEPTVPIWVIPPPEPVTSIVFVDSVTGELKGFIGPLKQPATIFIGFPGDGGNLDVYTNVSTDPTCDTDTDIIADRALASGPGPVVSIPADWLRQNAIQVDLGAGTYGQTDTTLGDVEATPSE